MKTDNLKDFWEDHKIHADVPGISEQEILSIIMKEDILHSKMRHLLTNAFSFSFLIIFCQTC